ncbi:MAG: YjjG family noncanonical pyrimidine nucleotidase [Cyclobacteriaceae bacterium]
MTSYSHIFFDLDHTLWDHERNSHETLSELYGKYDLEKLGGFDCPKFLETYDQVNQRLWRRYRHGEIDQPYIRKHRFELVLGTLDVSVDQVPHQLSSDYLEQAPLKTHVFPHTYELLAYLKSKYTLSIITNGFDDVQHTKIQSARLGEYFTEIVTSERAGCLKPDRNIFDFTCQKLDTSSKDCIMVGDNLETDIAGAKNADIDQVFFNPSRYQHETQVTFEVVHLQELEEIL